MRVFPAASRAVNVNRFEPVDNAMLPLDHSVVPLAFPLPPRLFVQLTSVTAMLSEADPPKVIVDAVVVIVELAVGVRIEMLGRVISGL